MCPVDDHRRTFLCDTQGMEVTREAQPEPPASHEDLRSTPAKTPSIVDTLIVKDGDLFMLTERDGDIPIDEVHGTGIYYHDCRFLDGYELRIAGKRLEALVSTAGRGHQSLIELTNPELLGSAGGQLARVDTIGVKWTRTLDSTASALHDQIVVRNFDRLPTTLPVSLSFRAGFHDVFNVRALERSAPGRLSPPEIEGRCLRFIYRGADDLVRTVTICFHRPPDAWDGTTAVFTLPLGPREEQEIRLAASISETPVGAPLPEPVEPLSEHDTLGTVHTDAEQEWRSTQTIIRSSSPVFDSVINRSLSDLYLLRFKFDGQVYHGAGLPWFGTLFGRDSVIAALQTIAFDPSIARQTLTILAAYQGTKCDQWKEEEPGKILHELRVGELAHLGIIPHSPYYGSIDATPLFLILAAEYFAWTGDIATIEALEPNIDAALRWLDAAEADSSYVSYHSTTPGGLVNQGWKDSDDGVPNADGSPAEPPIALVEIQAYAYMARVRIAGLYRRLGRSEVAERLEQQAADLRRRFDQDFWINARGCYALALQKGGRPVRVCSSNAGHALWAGIAEPDKAKRVGRRLLRSDMFSGWGIRTLSDRETAYSPVGYHLGSVWPHDNSLIVEGLRRYGFDKAATRVFSGMMAAATHFELYRLPELFAGFSQAEYGVPVHYPHASKPQAWAAGTVPHMLVSLLGLRPEADHDRLNVVSPLLPPALVWLELKNLTVGPHEVDLRFERTPTGVAVQVQKKPRSLEVMIKL
jgi:glycogen debranching enzyme